MINFLFWNLNKKPLQLNIKSLANNFDVDIFMFAECNISPDTLLRTLNQDSVLYYYSRNIGCQKITIYTRFSSDFLRPKRETSRITIRHLTLPGLRDILLAVLHLPSKFDWSSPSQSSECYEVANMIKEAEQEVGHSRTILVGDFNMNPFEDGFVSANGFNAVMCRRIAGRKNRIVQKREYPFFYNPMWNCFGDETPGPPGTYFYNVYEHVGYFWNMFDQVLIRPELLTCIDNNSVTILDSDGTISFLNSQGIPDSNIVSDHLPILFKINL
jgi:hypothetical protein